MTEPSLTLAVYFSDGHDPIYAQGTPREIRTLIKRIRMSWELYEPIPVTTKTLAAHSLEIEGMLVNPKQITRVSFVNETKELVQPPVGFDLSGKSDEVGG